MGPIAFDAGTVIPPTLAGTTFDELDQDDHVLLDCVVSSFGQLPTYKQDKIMAGLAAKNDPLRVVHVFEEAIRALRAEGHSREEVQKGIWRACADLASKLDEVRDYE